MQHSPSVLSDLAAVLPSVRGCERSGAVHQVVGLTAEVAGLTSFVGEQVIVSARPARAAWTGAAPNEIGLRGEVVGFRGNRCIVMPYGDAAGIGAGGRAVATGHPARVTVGDGLLGRVIDGLGYPLDDGPPVAGRSVALTRSGAVHPLRRLAISRPFHTGIRVLDGLLTCGRGQRMGIFAGSGVGKSTFLGMVARNGDSDVNVIALIGERGREVQEFIAHNLGTQGLAKSVLIVATSDQPALIRINAAWTAVAIADYFRERGLNVLFMMDSVTRFAMAQREIGLAAGEPPATRGYTPSVFALLPRLLERAGTGAHSSVTGFYTVLVEGDDLNEPITDAVRGTLDGHIVLSRDLAMAHHFPAVDVLASVSRLMPVLATQKHVVLAARVRTLLAAYRSARDLLEIGAYVGGSNPDVDNALRLLPGIQAFLRQPKDEVNDWDTMIRSLEEIAA